MTARERARKVSARQVPRGAIEHYRDPAYYSKTYHLRTRDVEYYVALARESGGPVLEYGVGNGRVALPIARAGIEIVGVDLSETMLEDLTRRHARLGKRWRGLLSWVHGDMRTVRLERRFALVIAPFNTVLHLYEKADVEEFLAGVRSHLAEGGRFVFDFSIPRADDLDADPDVWHGGPRLRHPTSGQLMRYRERFEYDAVRQVLDVDMELTPVDGGDGATMLLSHRQFFPCEMEAWLHYNGFTDIRFSADFTELEPDAQVDSVVASARAGRLAGAPRRG